MDGTPTITVRAREHDTLDALAWRHLSRTGGKNVPPLTALVTQIDEHRRNQRWAISDLLGIARSTVELI